VLEFALAELREVGIGDKRQDDICRKALLDGGFDAESVCCVDEDTGVLGGDDGVDYGGEVVNVRERLDTEDNVVEGAVSARSGFLGCADDYGEAVSVTMMEDAKTRREIVVVRLPCRGLNRSLPYVVDLKLCKSRPRTATG
jgi:hypothetical protein